MARQSDLQDDTGHPPLATIYDADAKTIMNQTMQSVIKGEMDINTALRQAEEKVNQLVQK